MTFDKEVTFQNSKKKKTGFHTKPDQFLCMAKFSETDLKTLLHLRWSSLQLGNGKVYNQWTVVLACCCGNLTIFTCKIKIG